MNIRAEDLVDAVSEELDIYANEVADTVKKTVTAVAKETVKVVKQKSPSASGAYKKSWAQKKTYVTSAVPDHRIQPQALSADTPAGERSRQNERGTDTGVPTYRTCGGVR